MITAKEIAQAINGELRGDGSVRITGVNGLLEATEGDVAFLLHARFAEQAAKTKAACVVVPRGTVPDESRTTIVVEQPSIAFSQIIDILMPNRIPHPRGIHPTAVVAKDARIGKEVSLGAYVVVEAGAVIGDGTVVYPQCYIGHKTTLGKSCTLYPSVTVREGITIGDRVTIHANTAIGSDGFGYDTKKDGSHVKIPQLGTVVIEDDVEIGSCVTIDRARLNKTVIGTGTKIDNLVQIAHNDRIGPYCLIASQTGLSGSVELGRNVVLGGQVGIADHVKLGDFCMAAAQSGISKSYPPRTTLLWFPAKPIARARELIASVALLPKLFARVRALEKKLKDAEAK